MGGQVDDTLRGLRRAGLGQERADRDFERPFETFEEPTALPREAIHLPVQPFFEIGRAEVWVLLEKVRPVLIQELAKRFPAFMFERTFGCRRNPDGGLAEGHEGAFLVVDGPPVVGGRIDALHELAGAFNPLGWTMINEDVADHLLLSLLPEVKPLPEHREVAPRVLSHGEFGL